MSHDRVTSRQSIMILTKLHGAVLNYMLMESGIEGEVIVFVCRAWDGSCGNHKTKGLKGALRASSMRPKLNNLFIFGIHFFPVYQRRATARRKVATILLHQYSNPLEIWSWLQLVHDKVYPNQICMYKYQCFHHFTWIRE